MLVQTKGLVYGVLSFVLSLNLWDFVCPHLSWSKSPTHDVLVKVRTEASLDFWSKTPRCTQDGVLDLETKAFSFHPGSAVPEHVTLGEMPPPPRL